MVVTMGKHLLNLSALHNHSNFCDVDGNDVELHSQVLSEAYNATQNSSDPNSSHVPNALKLWCENIVNQMMAIIEKGQLIKVAEDERKLFSLCCYIMADQERLQPKEKTIQLREGIRLLDLGLLFGHPLQDFDLIGLQDSLLGELDETSVDFEDDKFPEDTEEVSTVNTIPVEAMPSLQRFIQEYLSKGKPVMLRGCMSSWSALQKWKSIKYLKRMAGARLMPLELGDYSRGGNVRLMTLDKYLDEICSGKTAEECGYLAQHQLFDQVPGLADDIETPAYCAVANPEEVTTNVWLGPAKTSSPLHWDPQDNFLCQVMGTKLVTLFPPADSQYLYPREGRFTNTSLVNAFTPDLHNYPEFVRASPLCCNLRAGEMLFIPKGWWHAVRSLSASASVNFFF